jgi:fumarate hydratase class II
MTTSISDTEPLYGSETRKAIENFPISGEPVPTAVIHWLARIKGAAAEANSELGLLDGALARRIARAAAEVADGGHDEQFPIDVFQTGSGTSTNMNVNEVIARLAGDGIHPNDHVNLGQSTNDVFPSAVHLAALEQVTRVLLPALEGLETALAAKAKSFRNIVKAGRTHLMDAVPVTLGQEFSGYAAQIRLGRKRIESTLGHVAQIPLGGTAAGTGLNTHPKFAARVRQRLQVENTIDVKPPEDPFESLSNRDASGPRAGIGEILLPELQKGSSIMPGKVNPVIPEVVLQVAAQVIGNDTAITIGGMQGNLELNVRMPLIARNLLSSITLLSSAATVLDQKCVSGIEANLAGCERSAEATLSAATALNPHIGYDAATKIVQEAVRSGRPLREVAREQGVSEEVLDEALDLRKMALGS